MDSWEFLFVRRIFVSCPQGYQGPTRCVSQVISILGVFAWSVALSQEISLAENEILTLLAEGIPEARNFPVFRFFLNDFSTTTQGIDLISTMTIGRTVFSAIFNYTDTGHCQVEERSGTMPR